MEHRPGSSRSLRPDSATLAAPRTCYRRRATPEPRMGESSRADGDTAPPCVLAGQNSVSGSPGNAWRSWTDTALAQRTRDAPAPAGQVITASAPPGADMPFGAGTRVKHFELIREIGRGGMGQVYLA